MSKEDRSGPLVGVRCESLSTSARLLQRRWRVPGFLSGPRRFGAGSYSHGSERREQLEQCGRVESQRILRERLPRRKWARGYEEGKAWDAPLATCYHGRRRGTSRSAHWRTVAAERRARLVVVSARGLAPAGNAGRLHALRLCVLIPKILRVFRRRQWPAERRRMEFGDGGRVESRGREFCGRGGRAKALASRDL